MVFKPNISTLVGELYPRNDKRKDAAFTIFYMGINLGALFAPLVAGFLAEDLFLTTMNDGTMHYGFKWAFLASSIGMITGQIIFSTMNRKYLGTVGLKPNRLLAEEANENRDVPLPERKNSVQPPS